MAWLAECERRLIRQGAACARSIVSWPPLHNAIGNWQLNGIRSLARYACTRHQMCGERLKQLSRSSIARRRRQRSAGMWIRAAAGTDLPNVPAGLSASTPIHQPPARQLVLPGRDHHDAELERDAPRGSLGSWHAVHSRLPTGHCRPLSSSTRSGAFYLTSSCAGPSRSSCAGKWATIFGSDCLEVCPWNRFAREGKLMKAHADQDWPGRLAGAAGFGRSRVQARFAGTLILRAGRRGLGATCAWRWEMLRRAGFAGLQEAARDLTAGGGTRRWAIERFRQGGRPLLKRLQLLCREGLGATADGARTAFTCSAITAEPWLPQLCRM